MSHRVVRGQGSFSNNCEEPTLITGCARNEDVGTSADPKLGVKTISVQSFWRVRVRARVRARRAAVRATTAFIIRVRSFFHGGFYQINLQK